MAVALSRVRDMYVVIVLIAEIHLKSEVHMGSDPPNRGVRIMEYPYIDSTIIAETLAVIRGCSSKDVVEDLHNEYRHDLSRFFNGESDKGKRGLAWYPLREKTIAEYREAVTKLFREYVNQSKRTEEEIRDIIFAKWENFGFPYNKEWWQEQSLDALIARMLEEAHSAKLTHQMTLKKYAFWAQKEKQEDLPALELGADQEERISEVQVEHIWKGEVFRDNLIQEVFLNGHKGDPFYGSGRISLVQNIKKRAETEDIWLQGEPGSGKTAFMVDLFKNSQARVYFCSYSWKDTLKGTNVIKAIATALYQNVQRYREYCIHNTIDLQETAQMNCEQAFQFLLLEPLSEIRNDLNDWMIFGIDGLDEATENGRNEILEVLQKWKKLNLPGIHFIVASQKELLIQQGLTGFKTEDINGADRNADIGEYIRQKLKSCNVEENILIAIERRSGGNFFYAKLIVEEILNGERQISDIDSIPRGLDGLFEGKFSRIANRFDFEQYVRPVLEVFCGIKKALAEDELFRILKAEMKGYQLRLVLGEMWSVFPCINGVFKGHRCVIDWLTASPELNASRYVIDLRDANQRLAQYYGCMLEGEYNEYAYKYLCSHYLGCCDVQNAGRIMTDECFQKKRIEIMGLDAAIRDYLDALEELHEQDRALAKQVMCGQTFQHLLGYYRGMFYTTGLYEKLKCCGFDEVLVSKENDWGIGAEISIANYCYITHTYNDAIGPLEKLLERPNLSTQENAEIKSMLALCYQKNLEYERAELYFDEIIDQKDVENYSKAFSYMNKGKIACYQHKMKWWETAYRQFGTAINLMEEEIKNESLAVRKSRPLSAESRILERKRTIASYRQIRALYAVWAGDFNTAKAELKLVSDHYDSDEAGKNDHQYLRFQYTRAFFCLMDSCRQGNVETQINKIENWLRGILNLTKREYERGQVYFFLAVAMLLKRGTREERGKAKAKGNSYLYKAREGLEKINGRIELVEIEAIAKLYIGVELSVYASKEKSAVGQRWAQHVKAFVEKYMVSAESKEVELFIIRHGETDWNVQGLLQGKTDIELNKNGKQAAWLSKEGLRTIQFDVVYSSPLKRAMETAQIITERDDIIIDERLEEMDFGSAEGHDCKDPAKISEIFPEVKNVETIQSVQSRAFAVFKEIISEPENLGKRVFVSTHGMIIRGLLSKLQNKCFWDVPAHVNCGITILTIWKDGKNCQIKECNKIYYDTARLE